MPGRVAGRGRDAGRVGEASPAEGGRPRRVASGGERERRPRKGGKAGKSSRPREDEPMTYAQYAQAFASSFSSAFEPSASTEDTAGADAATDPEGAVQGKGATIAAAASTSLARARYEQGKSSGSLLSCLCGSRKEAPPPELPFEEPGYIIVCPAGHDLEKRDGLDVQCSNCSARVATAMFCERCVWGVCSQCYKAMCAAKPRKIPLTEGRLPKPASARSDAMPPAVTISLKLTLEDLLRHGKGLRVWFESQLYIQAVEKGVREACVPLLEEFVVITDARGRTFASYKALMAVGVTEEALPIVFKFDTQHAATQVSKSSFASLSGRSVASGG